MSSDVDKRPLSSSDFKLPQLIIERMHLAVSVPCQYDCLSCSHGAMRYKFVGYQLGLEQLREFIYFTEQSSYRIKKLHITGPGEPLLWKHLREGLKLLAASHAIESIHLISNGLNLGRIDQETWDHLDCIQLSIYPAFNKWDELNAALRGHRKKIKLIHIDHFRSNPAKGEVAPVPCACACTGPMFFDRKIFFYCGPTVFGAAESKGVDVYNYPEMYGEIGVNYMERSKSLREISPFGNIEVDTEKKVGCHELCRYCFANLNFRLAHHQHTAYPQHDRRRFRGIPFSTRVSKFTYFSRRYVESLTFRARRKVKNVLRRLIPAGLSKSRYDALRELWIRNRLTRGKST